MGILLLSVLSLLFASIDATLAGKQLWKPISYTLQVRDHPGALCA